MQIIVVGVLGFFCVGNSVVKYTTSDIFSAAIGGKRIHIISYSNIIKQQASYLFY